MDHHTLYELVGHRLQPVEYAPRTPEQIQLLERQVYSDTVFRDFSRPHDCFSFGHFTLYLDIDSTGTGTHEICFVPQFAVVRHGRFHDYPQGLFASLCYEDTDTAAGLYESFSGLCDGRFFRLRTHTANVSATLYFTVSAWLEFWN